jgi:multicomponent Na+:H+ antiporter subunit B
MRAQFESLMFRTLLSPLTASLRLFALYVLVHGHDSPGGGFQAGVVLGASFLLPRLIEGSDQDQLSLRGALALAASGVLIYALIGSASLLSSPFLDYAAIPLPGIDEPSRRALGILGIECGVAMAVAGVVVVLFDVLTEDTV